jgi:hypothetical protein
LFPYDANLLPIHPQFLDDTSYWMATANGDHFIVSINLDGLTHHKISLPIAKDPPTVFIRGLFIFRDHICILSSRPGIESHYIFWSLNDDKTWTNLCVIAFPEPVIISSALYMHHDNLLLRLENEELATYNVANHASNRLSIQAKLTGSIITCKVFQETIIWPFPGLFSLPSLLS